MSLPPRPPDLFFDAESSSSEEKEEEVDPYPDYDLDKIKNLLRSCKEETMLNSRGWTKCIGEKQQLESRFDDLDKDKRKLMKDYHDLEKNEGKLNDCYDNILFRNGDLYAEIDELNNENNELEARSREAEGQAVTLSEEKRILTEEMKNLQRLLCMRGRQQ